MVFLCTLNILGSFSILLLYVLRNLAIMRAIFISESVAQNNSLFLHPNHPRKVLQPWVSSPAYGFLSQDSFLYNSLQQSIFLYPQDISHVLQLYSLYCWNYFHLLTYTSHHCHVGHPLHPQNPQYSPIFLFLLAFQMISTSPRQLSSKSTPPSNSTLQTAQSISSVAP